MMRDERPDASLFIGLHKLAEQNGDGLVPELYTLLADRRTTEQDMTNVVAFPTTSPDMRAHVPHEGSGQVLRFRR